MVIPFPESSPEKKMPNTEPTSSPIRQIMSITATAIHPPAMIAAIRAFVPAIIALIAAMVALTATFTAWAVAFAVAFAACAARCAVLAEAFVVGKNALSLYGGFYRTDGMGYLGIKYLNPLSVGTPYRGGDFL